MNIAEPLLEFVEVEYHDEIWQQPVDYEQDAMSMDIFSKNALKTEKGKPPEYWRRRVGKQKGQI